MQAEVTILSPSSLLNSGPGDLKDSVQVVRGEGLRQRGMEELRAEKDYVKGKTTIDENVFQV